MTREVPGEVPATATDAVTGEATNKRTAEVPGDGAAAVLEPAGIAHAAAMAAIHRRAFPPAEAWGADAIALQLALPGVIGWVDGRGGMILARVAADEVEVLTLAVAPAARRRGLGSRLLDAAMMLATSRGARVAFLEVSIGNVAARTLYARAGFTPTGRRPRYYADGTDALVLRRTLTPASKGDDPSAPVGRPA